jgi:hypothetical protein
LGLEKNEKRYRAKCNKVENGIKTVIFENAVISGKV